LFAVRFIHRARQSIFLPLPLRINQISLFLKKLCRAHKRKRTRVFAMFASPAAAYPSRPVALLELSRRLTTPFKAENPVGHRGPARAPLANPTTEIYPPEPP
jgi:hypothetical protein